MTHDQEKRDALIRNHMAYVCRVADRYRDRGVPTEDLRQEAYVGLCMAADRYDSAKYPDVPFEVAAGFWSRKYVIDAIIEAGQHGVSQVPHRLTRAAGKCRAARERLIAAGERDPSIDRIAEVTGLKAAIVRKALDLPGQATQAMAAGILARLSDPKVDRAADEVWDALSLCSRLEMSIIVKLGGLGGGKAMGVRQVATELDLSPQEVLDLAERARGIIGEELRRKGWDLALWERQFARSA